MAHGLFAHFLQVLFPVSGWQCALLPSVLSQIFPPNLFIKPSEMRATHLPIISAQVKRINPQHQLSSVGLIGSSACHISSALLPAVPHTIQLMSLWQPVRRRRGQGVLELAVCF